MLECAALVVSPQHVGDTHRGASGSCQERREPRQALALTSPLNPLPTPPPPAQVTGTKRVLLWPPSQQAQLYIAGSSSPITHFSDQQRLRQQYPLFSEAAALQAELLPGDVLYIPALWFHNVLSETFSASVNLFWRHLPPACYERKDLYGNRDLAQVWGGGVLAVLVCAVRGDCCVHVCMATGTWRRCVCVCVVVWGGCTVDAWVGMCAVVKSSTWARVTCTRSALPRAAA